MKVQKMLPSLNVAKHASDDLKHVLSRKCLGGLNPRRKQEAF